MKKIILIASIALAIASCQKSKTSPSPADNSNKTTSVPTTTVWCIKSYTTFLECNNISQASANSRAQWYRDNGYTMMTVIQKSNCSECQ